jgi:ABC-type multidrug transport system ATPase subunit
VSTHLVFELEGLADHLAVLGNGKVVVQVSTDQLRRNLKRYVLTAREGISCTPPENSAVMLNGSSREHAWTMWGEEARLLEQLRERGAEIRDVRPLTLHESAVAFLGMERT